VKVAFFLPHFETGGVERVVLNLLVHLDRERFAPRLVLAERRGALLEELPDEIPVFDFDSRRMRELPRQLLRYASRDEPDLLYSGTNAANLAALAALRLLRRRPALVVAEHAAPGLYLDRAKWRSVRTLAMRHLYPLADRIAVPIAEVGIELCARLQRPGLPVEVLPNPVFDSRRLRASGEATPRDWPESGGPVLVAVGRLAPEKGFDLLLRAFAELRRRCVDLDPVLLILGEGEERTRLTGLASELGLGARVHLPGRVASPFPYLHRAAGFVLSSHFEGFGNVLIEAMACGVPVLATDCPVAPRRVLEEGRAGLLVEPNRSTALAGGMERLLREPQLAARMRERALLRAATFDVCRAVPAHEALFAKLCGD